MTSICIETCLAKCSVCLRRGDAEYFISAQEDFAHSEKLFVLIENLLSNNSVEYSDLNFIGCTLGPGSFGGIRVGVAAVNVLKVLLPDVKALGFNTLEVLAHAALPLVDKSVVLLAHGNKFYVAEVDVQGSLIQAPRSISKDELDRTIGHMSVITTSTCAALLNKPAMKIVELDAVAVMRFAQKIVHEGRISLYNEVAPVYISEPSITVSNK